MRRLGLHLNGHSGVCRGKRLKGKSGKQGA